jgi:carbon-monoxide dehydrogenase medium subunit
VRSFEFFEPTTIGEASSLLAQYDGEAELLGGGTDLIIGMKDRHLTPKYVISLEKVPGLEGITHDENNGLWVGAMTKMRTIERSSIVRERYTALAEGAEEVGSIQIRNLATIGGNIAHGSPAADTAAALLVLDAQVNIASGDGERIVPIADFFLGPGQTVLQKGEILASFSMPPRSANSGSQYLKHKIRQVMDLAFVGVATAVDVNNGTVEDTKIGLAAVAPKPIRATNAETIITGHSISDEILGQAAGAAAAQSSPISDLRCSADHRREIVAALTKETAATAVARAQG